MKTFGFLFCILCAAGNFALAALVESEFAPLNWTSAGFALGIGFADVADWWFGAHRCAPETEKPSAPR